MTPAGETWVGGFTAGYKKTNPFYVLLVPALTSGTGVGMTPNPISRAITGILAEPGVAARFIEANERGGRVNTDLSVDWDFWPLTPLSLAAARAQLGIT